MTNDKRPFLRFDKNGKKSVFAKSGDEVQRDERPLQEIIGNWKLKKAESITVLEFEGSCEIIIIINGVPYTFSCD